MIAKETCACGAVVEVEDDGSADVMRVLADFREAHWVCRNAADDAEETT